jgi:asparagine synthase (glutamine-hydrolysing)
VQLLGAALVSLYLLNQMNQVTEHRGPDAATTYVGDGVGLAHRRLSIIDISGSDQPMFNEDGEIALIYNGEFYNFQEVRAELIERGHIFRTNGDTEIIVHGWEDCVDPLPRDDRIRAVGQLPKGVVPRT